jgi:pyruvate-formate lyase-activating enzyme
MTPGNFMTPPLLVVSDCKGAIFEIPGLFMTGSSLHSLCVPDDRSVIPLPASGVLFTLPKRAPIGYDPVKKQFVTIERYQGAPVYATAAFMPPGYIRTLHSSFDELHGAPRLPLYCYAAVGWRKGKFFVAGSRIDRGRRHSLSDAEMTEAQGKARAFLKRYPRNRLVSHLVNNCVLTYQCPNACNLVLGRWECPIAVSSSCNAACFGCISKQPQSSGFPASQHRIDFVPTVREIVEYVVPHLETAPDPIASFGQGCEGEPLLQTGLIEEAIRAIRLRTRRGIINCNTNASIPEAVERLCKAGLDSMRVSCNSARSDFYGRYYRPRGFSFEDVRESIAVARRYKVWVSINYLVFPGFTDHPDEVAALMQLLRMTNLNMVQTRNLNIDPGWFKKSMGLEKSEGKTIGMVPWIDCIRKKFPRVALGYFNPTEKKIRSMRGERTNENGC